MIEHLAIAFLVLGGAFLLLGSLGVLRFEDVYLRLQFSTKSLTFGLSFYLLGAALATGAADSLPKAGLAIAFQFMTAPIAGTMIAKVAMRRGHTPAKMVGEERDEPSAQAPPTRRAPGARRTPHRNPRGRFR